MLSKRYSSLLFRQKLFCHKVKVTLKYKILEYNVLAIIIMKLKMRITQTHLFSNLHDNTIITGIRLTLTIHSDAVNKEYLNKLKKIKKTYI